MSELTEMRWWLRSTSGLPLSGRHFVYVLGFRGTAIYVGVSSNVRRRIKQHLRRFEALVDEINYCELPTRAKAEEFELRMIKMCRPVFNVAGKLELEV